MPAVDYDQIHNEITNRGTDEALDQLAASLKEQGKYHELFNVRQIQVRSGLGLEVLNVTDTNSLEPQLRDKIEEGYIEACREVGQLLLDQGKISEAWGYLQVIGETEQVTKALESSELDEESASDLVDIALYQGVAPDLGFSWVLQFFGTCNAITAIEAALPGLSPQLQQALVGRLVRHVHAELLENVRAGVAELGETPGDTNSISQLLNDHPKLMQEQGYHIDTSHLSSTAQHARILEETEEIRLAIELADYGSRLDDQLKFPGEAPFTDLYPSLQKYLGAFLGENIDEAVSFFKQQAEAVDIEEEGSLPAEVYITLLARLQRYDEAFDETVRLIPNDIHTTGFAPNLLELAARSGMYDRLMQICRDQDDLLGYVAGLVDAKTRATG